MQIIHNDFKIDSRSHFSLLRLGVGEVKNKQKKRTDFLYEGTS